MRNSEPAQPNPGIDQPFQRRIGLFAHAAMLLQDVAHQQWIFPEVFVAHQAGGELVFGGGIDLDAYLLGQFRSAG